VVSATARPFTVCDVLEPDDGSSVGNRFAALPPGLSVGLLVAVTPGRLPTGSGDVVVIGAVDGLGVVGVGVGVGVDVGVDVHWEADADGDGLVVGVTVPEIWTVADDDGFLVRLAAVPVTVNVTDFTDDAVVATVDSAWSCRCADVESTAPRSHDAVASSLPQPKLNFGAMLDGVACSRTIASVRLPPVVQALTTH
jgi:hypothetical protein